MKRHKNLINSIIFLLMFFIIINIMQIDVNAEPTDGDYLQEQLDNIKTYKIGTDIVSKGAFSGNSWYFNVDKWWEVIDVQAEIKVSINQLVEENKDAYISFSVNGTPFYSQKIYYDQSVDIQNITVSIPKDLVKKGSNEFKVETYLRNSDLPCIDDVNTANWITIKGDSSVKVNFSNILADNKISNFPYPYLKVNDNVDLGNALVIPDNYTDGELSAALLLDSYMSKLYGSSDYNGKIYKYSDAPKNQYINYIFIGNYNSISSEINLGIDENSSNVIKVIDSPYGSEGSCKLMAIVGNDDNMLIKAVNSLINPDILMQLNSDIFYIDEKLDEKIKESNREDINKVTFKDIGNNEIQLKGPFRRTATVSYNLPKNKSLVPGDKIKLYMRYSENLDFDRALVTLYINGTPIGSKKLEKEKAQNDELELTIPSDINLSNYMDMKIAFDLEMTNSYCEKRQEEMPWALVTGDSYIYSAMNNIEDYYFSNYGAPFVSDRVYNNTLIVIPDNLSSEDLTAIGGIFSYLGKDITYNTGKLQAIRFSNLKGEEKDNNLIIYGTPENNPLIKSINDKLWFKYDNEYLKFLSNEKLFLTDPYSSEITTFQLDKSAFNTQRAMLVLTSKDENNLRDSLKYLSSSEKLYELHGDSAVLDKYGNIKTYKFKKDTEKPAYEKVKELDSNAKGMIILVVLFVLFAVVSLTLFYLKNRKVKDKKIKKK